MAHGWSGRIAKQFEKGVIHVRYLPVCASNKHISGWRLFAEAPRPFWRLARRVRSVWDQILGCRKSI